MFQNLIIKINFPTYHFTLVDDNFVEYFTVAAFNSTTLIEQNDELLDAIWRIYSNKNIDPFPEIDRYILWQVNNMDVSLEYFIEELKSTAFYKKYKDYFFSTIMQDKLFKLSLLK